MFRTIRLVAIFLGVTNLAQAGGLADSLSKVLTRKDLTMENRITTMGLLARATCVTNSEGAMRIENEALQLCRQANDPKSSTFIWSIMVMLQYYYGKSIPKCREAADSALYYAQQSNDKLSLGIAWYRKAWVENLQAKWKDAVNSSLEALKYLEDAGNGGYTYIASVYYIITGAHANWSDLPQQGKYARLGLEAARQSGDYDDLLAAFQAMSTYYHYCYDINKTNHSLLDSAFWYNRQGINLYKGHAGWVVFKSTLAVIAFNMANLYQQYKVGNYKDSVAPYLQLALKTAQETKQAAVIASSFGLMSELEIEKGNYENAEQLLLAGVAVLPMDSINHQRNKVQLLDGLARLAEKQGNYAKALKYHKDYHTFYEALYDADKVKIAKDLEEKYQSEQKEQSIQALHAQNALNRKMKYLYAFMALLAVVAGMYIFRSYNFRLKASQHQKKLLQQENEDAALLARIKQQEVKQLELEKLEAELKARLKEEEALRLLAEQKLMQEREGRLQKDLLAVNLQVEQKDELLQSVQKKIEESKDDRTAVKKINSIIDQNKKSDDAFASSKADFDTIRPEFFQQLKEKSADKLSRLDLKHCSYISLGLTNKEVAQRLGIAPKSILMARYRIKIKLGLSKDDDLDDFIATLSR
jgi:hypothetical protein